MTAYCPPTLLSVVQLSNYYVQRVFEYALAQQWRFPHAVYLDSVLEDGTIVTGTDPAGTQHSYAFAATLVLSNVYHICGGMGPTPPAICAQAVSQLQLLREAAPVALWSDPAHGRLTSWPPLPTPQA